MSGVPSGTTATNKVPVTKERRAKTLPQSTETPQSTNPGVATAAARKSTPANNSQGARPGAISLRTPKSQTFWARVSRVKPSNVAVWSLLALALSAIAIRVAIDRSAETQAQSAVLVQQHKAPENKIPQRRPLQSSVRPFRSNLQPASQALGETPAATASPATHERNDNAGPLPNRHQTINTPQHDPAIDDPVIVVPNKGADSEPRKRIESVAAPPVPVGIVTSQLRLPDHVEMPTLATTPAPKLVPGTLVKEVLPKAPPANPNPIVGNVSLVATVNKKGEVEDVSLEEGQKSSPLSQAAIDAIRKWRYTPFTINGIPVRATTRVLVKFK